MQSVISGFCNYFFEEENAGCFFLKFTLLKLHFDVILYSVSSFGSMGLFAECHCGIFLCPYFYFLLIRGY